MSGHPYLLMPNYTRWRSVAGASTLDEVDPVGSLGFKIRPGDKVATAGSCFAQHIARHLRLNEFDYYVAEDAPKQFDEDLREQFNYGLFSARFGNIYTTRQLTQLFERAFGTFSPVEESWTGRHNRLIDPLRPTIQPDGFESFEELDADRRSHLAAVRRMFTELDFLVFTLGLTETWMSREDGTAFPVCPGVAGGMFNPARHFFHNLTVHEVVADLTKFLSMLNALNRRAKVIFTVSPVPLAATAENRHVLVSNTYSKSVLRIACEEVVSKHDFAYYFPSFEIITGNYNRGAYYDADLRTVTEAGVSHVMKLFFRHATMTASIKPKQSNPPQTSLNKVDSATLNKVLCDEEMLMHI